MSIAGAPQVGTINAERVVVAREIHGGVDVRGAQQVTILTFSSGQRIERAFANVPAQGVPLVGRQEAFTELRTRIADGGKLAVHGLPGAGKSALALALAYDEATLAHFRGGVLWAGLGPSPNVGNILNLWGTALGADVSAVPSPTERAQRLNAHVQSALAGRPLLVVLDDAWKTEDLVDFYHFVTPGYALLLTTRDEALARRFAGPSRVVHVPELDEAAAVSLLTQDSPEIRAVAPEKLRELVRAVGSLPLALVLMAKELAAEGGHELWLRTRVEELRSAKERLALREDQLRPGLTGVPLTLQAAVELSLDGIPDEATRAAFAELGVFAPKPADFARAAALAVWQVDEKVGDARLRTLWQRGVLESTQTAGAGRFTLHQVLAAVASVRLENSAAVAARHLAYYLTLVDTDREAWQSTVAELAQIQQAWEWAARTPGQDRRVLELVGALHLLMERRGLRAQQRAWLERAVEAARALGNRAEEGRLLGSLGLCWWQLGQHGKAIDCLERALALARELGDRQAEGRHLGSLGLVWATAMFRDQAMSYYDEALAIARELDDRQAEESHLGVLGLAWAEEGMAKLAWGEVTKDTVAPYFRKAIAYYEQALAIARTSGNRPGEGGHLGNLGNAWLHLGDGARAIDLINQALTIFREVGDRPNEGFHLANLGSAHQALGEAQQAQRCWREALTIYDSYGDPRAAALKTWLQKFEEAAYPTQMESNDGHE